MLTTEHLYVPLDVQAALDQWVDVVNVQHEGGQDAATLGAYTKALLV